MNSALLKTLNIQRAGIQKFKKQQVISTMSHIEKRVDCTYVYVLNASSKGSGETPQMRRLTELSLLLFAIKTMSTSSK